MKVLFFGNIYKDIGPCIVNRSLSESFDDRVVFFKETNATDKIFKMFSHITKVEITHFSGLGLFNLCSLVLSRILLLPSTYTMHGAVLIENRYSNEFSFKFFLYELLTLTLVKKIVCLSSTYERLLIRSKYYRIFRKKIIIIPNGIVMDRKYRNKLDRNSKLIISSIGGGRREKNILNICRALNELDSDVEFHVIGPLGEDISDIKRYPFVIYHGVLKHKDVMGILEMSHIYIQNSSIESFGISCFEAVYCGCDLIVSENVGMRSYVNCPSELFVVTNDNNESQILEKLKYLQVSRNNKYVINGINEQELSWDSISERYIELWRGL